MQCTNPIWMEKQKLRVPCLRCRACRIRRSSEWTLRLEHELYTKYNQGIFLTLTYDNNNLKYTNSVCGVQTLVKKDLQRFFKTLKQKILRKYGYIYVRENDEYIKYPVKPIKYYACGEYGTVCQNCGKSQPKHGIRKENKNRCVCSVFIPSIGRPHYHSIILGLDYLNNEDHILIRDSWNYHDWNNPSIRSGSIGSASADSMRYTADYIQKRFYNKDENKLFEHYRGREPEFQIQSQGIGKDYALSITDQIYQTGKLLHKSKERGLPRYYDTIIEKHTGSPSIHPEVARINKYYGIQEQTRKNNGDIFNPHLITDEEEKILKQTEQNIKKRKSLAKDKNL